MLVCADPKTEIHKSVIVDGNSGAYITIATCGHFIGQGRMCWDCLLTFQRVVNEETTKALEAGRDNVKGKS